MDFIEQNKHKKYGKCKCITPPHLPFARPRAKPKWNFKTKQVLSSKLSKQVGFHEIDASNLLLLYVRETKCHVNITESCHAMFES